MGLKEPLAQVRLLCVKNPALISLVMGQDRGGMTRSILICLIVVSAAGVGCGGEPAESWKLAGESAPAFSGDLPGFLKGRWTPDGELFSDAEAEPEKYDFIEFTPEAAFKYRIGGVLLGGTWKESGGAVMLTYTTMNGEPIEAKMAEVRKNSERGLPSNVVNDLMLDNVQTAMSRNNQVHLGEDGRTLGFGPPPAASQEGAMEDMLSGLSQTTLERMVKSEA
jgi:hypothetical protein